MGWDGMGWDGVGGLRNGKTSHLGHLMNSHDTHTVANTTLVSGPKSQGEQTQVPTAQLVLSIGAIVPVVTFGGPTKCPSEKQHLTLDTLGMDGY